MWITEDDETLLHCCSCKSLLRDPMLLQCLHNVCRKCLNKVCCTRNGSTSLVCPACNYETAMGIEKENLFVAGQVDEFEKQKNVRRCGVCIQSGKTNESVDAWCSKCQMSMCEQCSSDHYLHLRDHWPTSLSEVRSMNDLLGTPAHKCRHHGRTYDLLCWACKIPACIACAKECLENKHDVGVLNSQRTWDHFEKIKENICRIQTSLDSKRKTLLNCKNVVSDLDAAQTNDMKELQANKRAAAESLERAYEAAEAALKEHYSKLHERALELKRHIELVDVRTSHASQYSRYSVATNDKTGLLHQEAALLSGLQALVEELDKVKASQDATKFVAVVGAVPENLVDHMSTSIGMPRLLADDLYCRDELITTSEMALKKSVELGAIRSHPLPVTFIQKGSLQNLKPDLLALSIPGDIALEVLDMGPALSTFQSPVMCCDVAVSADGCSLLLATMGLGLKELDLSGSERSNWRPAKNMVYGRDELVWTVDALQDGRVAAGLLYSQSVVLLRRGQRVWPKGDAWLEDMRIMALQIAPRRLSVHADLIAVAEGTLNEEKMLWLPGRGLAVVSLRGGQMLYKERKEYRIGSVAVTAQTVVTASCDIVKLSNGRVAWVVDACSHDGELVWRQELYEVWDMCAAPSGRVLYITLCESGVAAVRAEDGTTIKGILTNSSHHVKGPARLSMNVREQDTMAAVLSSDWTTVTVYPAKLKPCSTAP